MKNKINETNEVKTNDIVVELKCGCPEHKIVFDFWKAKNDENFRGMNISIYQLCNDSSKCHRKLKYPKLLGDVVLLDVEIKKFIKYAKKVERNLRSR